MPVTIDLKNTLVLVTGGGRGLGVDIVKAVAEAGANVAITYNATPADKLAVEVAQEHNVNVKAYKMPANDSKAISSVIEQITRDMGEIDVVVANAGICIHRDAEAMTDEEFEEVFRVNTFFPYYLSRAVYKTWYPEPSDEKKNKKILYISSISGLISNTPQNQCSYNASKAALTMLAKSLAGEWAKNNVRVNVISPGYIETEMSTGAAGAPGWISEWSKRTPLGRFAQPSEIADLVVLMSSDKAAFMTGSDVVIDGGYTIF